MFILDFSDTAATQLTVFDLFLTIASIHLPSWTFPYLARVPTPIFRALNKYRDLSYRTAADVMQAALADPAEREEKDVTGILASSYHSLDPEQKLPMEEVLAQMRCA